MTESLIPASAKQTADFVGRLFVLLLADDPSYRMD